MTKQILLTLLWLAPLTGCEGDCGIGKLLDEMPGNYTVARPPDGMTEMELQVATGTVQIVYRNADGRDVVLVYRVE